jgi:ribosomal protein L7Ae-like RNA K-turn-binding protein
LKQDKVLGMLGLAKRAGAIESGEFSAEKAVKTFRSHLIILAGDASENTRKKFTDKASFRKIPVRIYADKDQLGRATGTGERSVLSVCDAGFAASLLKLLDEA